MIIEQNVREFILFIVQIASLIALIVYVIKTADMAREAEKSAALTERNLEEMIVNRNLEFAPYIVVYFDAMTDSPVFDLVVKNTGKTIANNIVIAFNPPLQSSLSNLDLSELSMLKKRIPSMPPEYEFRTAIDRLETRLASDDLPKIYEVKVTYTGGLDNKVREIQYLLDLNVYRGMMESNISSLSDLTHVVEEIPAQLAELTGSTERINGKLALLNESNERLSEKLTMLTDKVEPLSNQIQSLMEKAEELPKLTENLEEIPKAIVTLGEKIGSKTNKVW
ncbi:MAG: hypothetical protein KBA03_02795 [Anaerolineaceae bacterium]|nr:hypothetical protein [Anaerolineaceae bacterium]